VGQSNKTHLSRAAFARALLPFQKPFSDGHETILKQNWVYPPPGDQQWGSVMWAFIENVYREYCLARLQEMRKYELSH
jgi:hypothetical protein